ncbi:acyl transferase [Aggregatimonas sangjinii]|uniref:Acyl transferase n=1 Tax=Aggregatimonas sangjinii TaxID=2583587 RepID=A0A5B7SNM3_9FLAO|nr:acyl transferase [Aggregatimonas sangjinii]QCW98597.1 acyl transferase [Aggregatimonas sangjinii]
MIGNETIFNIASEVTSDAPAYNFESVALSVFQYQYEHNQIYCDFCNHLKKDPASVLNVGDIPFLPIEFFKKYKITTGSAPETMDFSSSGTTGSALSKHYVTDISTYKTSYTKGFAHFYGAISDYCVLALLPSYLERDGSSLIYMVTDLIAQSGHPESGFYLDAVDDLAQTLTRLDAKGTKVLLIGVSFALLDLVETYSFRLRNTIVMETGGMKGRRKEMIREELHDLLKKGFGVTGIHSEYGMTELLSQAYSLGNGIFETPPWMRVLVRDTEDPLTEQPIDKTGGINVIDLANINSCAFIATQDLGKRYEDGRFEILGRFDHSDIRGCNLMVL